MRFVRYESPVANAAGKHVGIFALANGLARSGRLSPDEFRWWRSNNDWLDAACPDPARADPTLFDGTGPHVACWFRTTATHLLDRVPGYLRLLDRYGLAWTELTSDDPGQVLYADEVQVVVAAVGSRVTRVRG